MTKVVVVIGLLCAVVCSARTTYSPNHERYRLKHHRGGEYDLYIVWPKCQWSLEYSVATLFAPSCVSEAEVAHSFRLLNIVTDFVDSYSRANGHVNAMTEPHHLYELEKLRSGAWPTVLITAPDNPFDVRMMVSVAVPETLGELPPFFLRFQDKGLADFDALKDSLWAPHILQQGEDFWISVFGVDAMGEPFATVRPDLSRIARHFPWALGAPAEFKFLIGSHHEPQDLFYAIFHALSTRQLFRYSHVELTERLRDEQRVILLNKDYQREQLDLIEQSVQMIRKGRLPKYLLEQHLNRLYRWKNRVRDAAPIQTRIMNDMLYAQVSSHDGAAFEVLSRYFVKRVGFPDSKLYEMAETHRTGTPGIRTRIYRFPASYFDENMVDHQSSLNELHGTPYKLIWRPTDFQELTCAELVSTSV